MEKERFFWGKVSPGPWHEESWLGYGDREEAAHTPGGPRKQRGIGEKHKEQEITLAKTSLLLASVWVFKSFGDPREWEGEPWISSFPQQKEVIMAGAG